MRRNKILLFFLIILCIGHLHAQTLQVDLSSVPKVNRSTTGGTATIFFDSSIEDLSIICTEENPNELITKINDHQWFVNIDVNEDIETDGICYRNYVLKCSASAEYYLVVDEIIPNQVLYYTITLPNELEPKLFQEKAKNISELANKLVNNGDSYLARVLLLKFMDTTSNCEYPSEIESAIRYASLYDNAVLSGNRYPVSSLSFDHADKYVVGGAYDGDIYIWDEKSGKLLFTLKGHTDKVTDVVFFQNDLKLMSSSYDKTAKIWDIVTGECLMTLNLPYDTPNCISLSPDESSCVVGYKNGQLSVMPLDSSSLFCKKVHSQAVTNIIWNTSGIITASNDGLIKIWDSSKWSYDTLEGHNSEFISISVSHDGKYLASVAHWDDFIRIWDLQKKSLISTLEEKKSRFTSVAFSNDDKEIVTTSEDGAIRVWNLLEKRVVNVIEGHPKDPNIIKYNNINKHVITLSNNNTIRLIDLKEGKSVINQLGIGYGGIIATCPTENVIAYIHDHSIIIRDIESQKETVIDANAEYSHNNIVFSPDGKLIAHVGHDKILRVWDSKTRELVHWINALGNQVSFSPDGKYIACSGKNIQIWEIANWRFYTELKNTYNSYYPSLEKISYSHDGKYIASVYDSNIIVICNVVTGEICNKITCDYAINSLTWSLDDQHLLVASGYRAIVIDKHNGNIIKTFDGHTEEVYDAIYSRDGQYVFTLGFDRTIKLWKAHDGKQLLTMYANIMSGSKLAISKNDDRLYEGELGGISSWYIHSLQDLIENSRTRFKNRNLTQSERNLFQFE